MAPKGMVWDAETDRKFFLGIMKTHNIQINFEAMAKYMSTDDQVCTPEALKSRIKKLRAMAKDAEVGEGVENPRANTSGRKRGATAAADDDGESPSKMPKTTKGKAGKGRQVEAQDNSGGDDEEFDGDDRAGVKEEEEN